MIEVEIIDAYRGGIYNKTIKRYIASSFKDVLNYVNKLNKDNFNTSHRVIIRANKEYIKDIPILDTLYNLDDIDSISIEYTMDMCPIIECVNIGGYKYDNDIFKDTVDLKLGDIVLNRCDGKYYLVVRDPNEWSLSEALWNDNNPSGLVSRYDIHKVSKYEYEYYNLHKLELLRDSNSVEEYDMILEDICENHPKMMNYITAYKKYSFNHIIFTLNSKIEKFKYYLYKKKLDRYMKK